MDLGGLFLILIMAGSILIARSSRKRKEREEKKNQ